jgi:hypothetical protein
MDHDSYPVILVQEDQDGITRVKHRRLYFYCYSKGWNRKGSCFEGYCKHSGSRQLAFYTQRESIQIFTVTAEIAEGYNVGLVSRDVEAVMADYEPASWI